MATEERGRRAMPAAPDAALAHDLLAATTSDARRERLAAAGLLDPRGLRLLLDHAAKDMRRETAKAGELAAICAELAVTAGAPELVPRATYLRAQAAALSGDLDTARTLIEEARRRHVARGEVLDALRTNIGLMHVLSEMGRHDAAVTLGHEVLSALSARPASGERETTEIAAMANQNVGAALQRLGRYDEALAAYASAEAGFAECGAADRLVDVANNRGVVLLRLGRAREALAAFETAVARSAAAKEALSQARALTNVGAAQIALAHYTDSLRAFERARQLFAETGATAEQHLLLLDTAEAYRALNLLPEALAAYREADRLLPNDAIAAHRRALARWGLGATLAALGEVEDAEAVLEEAARLFAEARSVAQLPAVLLEQAHLREARGDRAAARAKAAQARSLAADGAWPLQLVAADLALADLQLPDTRAAAAYLARAADSIAAVPLPALRAQLDARRGHLALLDGRASEARTHLGRAIDEFERMRGGVAQAPVRAAFFGGKTAAYDDLVLAHLADGEVGAAFAAAERARARSLVDLLADADGRNLGSAGSDPSAGSRALEADLGAIYSGLLAAGSAHDARQLQVRAVELERQVGELRLRAAVSADTTDPLGAPASRDEVRLALRDDLLVAYYVAGDEVLAFVDGPGGSRVRRQLTTRSSVDELIARLATQWERLRLEPRTAARHAAALERSARRVLSVLHGELVGPLAPLLGSGGRRGRSPRLVVVPHGSLHQVPFHALFDGQRYFGDQFAISLAPSATVLARRAALRTRPRRGPFVVGVPDPSLPAVAREVRAVAGSLGATRVRVGAAATVAEVLAGAPGSSVVHLACHGLFRADNPMFSALKLHDGWLGATELLGLDLSGALVTLSACESGRGSVVAGDEVLGLARAVLGAGAAALVVSQWLVSDASASRLMRSFYGGLRRGVPCAVALGAARRALMAREPHPFNWAAFTLIGDGGSTLVSEGEVSE